MPKGPRRHDINCSASPPHGSFALPQPFIRWSDGLPANTSHTSLVVSVGRPKDWPAEHAEGSQKLHRWVSTSSCHGPTDRHAAWKASPDACIFVSDALIRAVSYTYLVLLVVPDWETQCTIFDSILRGRSPSFFLSHRFLLCTWPQHKNQKATHTDCWIFFLVYPKSCVAGEFDGTINPCKMSTKLIFNPWSWGS